jgi:hypothetical protein
MEIRDYRRRLDNTCSSFNDLNKNSFDLHFVLLQPSMQTLLADLNSITNDGNYIWTQEDKYALESQLLLATTPSLCLNPSPTIAILKNKIHLHKLKMSQRHLKRSVYKYSEIYSNRSSRWHNYALPYPFQIMKIRNKYQYSNESYKFQKTNMGPDQLKLLSHSSKESTNCKIIEKNSGPCFKPINKYLTREVFSLLTQSFLIKNIFIIFSNIFKFKSKNIIHLVTFFN